MAEEKTNVHEEIIYGRNSVIEALRSGKSINKILIASGEKKGSIMQIIALAKENGIIIQEKDRKKMDELCSETSHQGVVAYLPPFQYVQLEDALAYAEKKNEAPLLLLLDEIQDPHNVGALLRSAEAVGVHGVLLPKRRTCPMTAAVAKSSAGALEHLLIIRIGNIVQTLKQLKKLGFWVTGADMYGEKSYYDADLKGPLVIVVGGEGNGLGRLVKENCDYIVNIPMKGRVNSLNASVAGAVLLFEAMKQRNVCERRL